MTAEESNRINGYSIFVKATGEILRTGTSHLRSIAEQQVTDDSLDYIEGQFRSDAFIVKDGVAVPRPPRDTDLAELKARLAMEIDAEAGAQRASRLTITPGQELIYRQKQTEAAALATDPQMDTSRLVLLSREAAVRGVSVVELAAQVNAAAANWWALAAEIEAVRIAGKQAVAAAKTPGEARAARALDWSKIGNH